MPGPKAPVSRAKEPQGDEVEAGSTVARRRRDDVGNVAGEDAEGAEAPEDDLAVRRQGAQFDDEIGARR